jgi:hypothetical protein
MAGMGFGNRWWGWIMQCISTTKMLVLVNGFPTKEFGLEKGLHQEDPSSISFSFQQCKSGAELYVIARLIFGLDWRYQYRSWCVYAISPSIYI